MGVEKEFDGGVTMGDGLGWNRMSLTAMVSFEMNGSRERVYGGVTMGVGNKK